MCFHSLCSDYSLILIIQEYDIYVFPTTTGIALCLCQQGTEA